MKYNWKPVVESLIINIQSAGFNLQSVNDGEELFPQPSLDFAVDTITGVDEAWASFTDSNGVKRSVFIVLGNEPCEIVCDYTCPKNTPQDDPIQMKWEKAMDEFSEFWDGKPCPLAKK
jgi:hypothetical protein